MRAVSRRSGACTTASRRRAAAAAAVELFDEVNLDLMYGLPGQGVDDALADVEEALTFRTTHLSCYQLTLEPNTAFHRHPPPLPDEDDVDAMGSAIEARLARAGFGHYEVSAYARPGHESRHNVNYWRFGDYLGIGAGAHAKVSMPDRVVREVRWKQPKQYMERVGAGEPVMERREVPAGELGFEFMLNALRLTAGVPASLFAERTGLPLATVAREIAVATSRGLLDPDPSVLRATPLGRRFLNELVGLFLRDPAPAKAAGVTDPGGPPRRRARAGARVGTAGGAHAGRSARRPHRRHRSRVARVDARRSRRSRSRKRRASTRCRSPRADRRSGCRSASRTSSTPRRCPPRWARRSARDAGRRRTRPACSAGAPRTGSSSARR